MILQNKKILHINLTEKTFNIALHAECQKYIGGVGLGAKVLSDIEQTEEGSVSSEPIIFSIGPLNGYFPYVSKTSVLYRYRGDLCDEYLGGSLGSRIKFFGVDSIVVYGRSAEPVVLELIDDKVVFHPASVDVDMLGLPGKRSAFMVEGNELLLNSYFMVADKNLKTLFNSKNLVGFVITGAKTLELPKSEKYKEIYDSLLNNINDLSVEKNGNPSCTGCPMGCAQSKVGEVGGNYLVHSLVGCSFAEKLFSDHNVVFSCLDAIGTGYTHEDLEKFSSLVYDLIESLKR